MEGTTNIQEEVQEIEVVTETQEETPTETTE
jgi:hypothetical protein